MALSGLLIFQPCQKQLAYKEEDPEWVDPVTGKKSVGGRQWRFIDQGYGDTIEGKEYVYGDVSYNIWRRRNRYKPYCCHIEMQTRSYLNRQLLKPL